MQLAKLIIFLQFYQAWGAWRQDDAPRATAEGPYWACTPFWNSRYDFHLIKPILVSLVTFLNSFMRSVHYFHPRFWSYCIYGLYAYALSCIYAFLARSQSTTAAPEKIEVFVDDKPVMVEPGITVLQASTYTTYTVVHQKSLLLSTFDSLYLG